MLGMIIIDDDDEEEEEDTGMVNEKEENTIK
jgi:hypothetical protein